MASALPSARLVLAVELSFGLLTLSPFAKAQTESAILKFPAGYHGSNPLGGLISDSNGILYGTVTGGSKGNGEVFSLSPPAEGSTNWVEDVLYGFKGGQDGSTPVGTLVAGNDGALYGVTQYGGGPSGFGTVFKLNPPKAGSSIWKEAVVYRFPGTINGSSPVAGLVVGNGGVLFGTTHNGGKGGQCGIVGCGQVFELVPPKKGQSQWIASALYSFQGGSDGSAPSAALFMDSSGALYGTTSSGGGGYNAGFCNGSGNSLTGCGTVFKLKPPVRGQSVWTESVIYTFSGGTDGAVPYSRLIADSAGDLFGTTLAGGSCGGNPWCGVVFELNPPAKHTEAWSEKVIYAFSGYPSSGNPYAGVTWGPNQVLYGSSDMSVYNLIPPTEGTTSWTENDLFIFDGTDGKSLMAETLVGSSGNLFGTASEGGRKNAGLVFEIQQ